LSPNDLLIDLADLIFFAASVIVAFRALRLRPALVDRPYRSRALWTGIGALSIWGFGAASYVDGVFGETPTTAEGVLAEAAIWGFTFLVLYGWILANIDVAITADYFNRDALSWKRGGKITAVVLVVVGYALASLPPWWLPSSFESNGIGSDLVTALFILAAAYATLVLALVYRRIQDPRIRSYTLWMTLSFVCYFVGIFSLGSAVAVIPALAWAYTMNRSAGTLAIRTRTLPT